MSSQVGSAESSHHGLARTSLNSDVARPVTVVNETVAPVQLYWVNYEGAPPARSLYTSTSMFFGRLLRVSFCMPLPAHRPRCLLHWWRCNTPSRCKQGFMTIP